MTTWSKEELRQIAETEVTFEPVDGPINDRIDDDYRAKYHNSPYLNPMIGTQARAATVKVILRETPA